jgi:hypothetical protein
VDDLYDAVNEAQETLNASRSSLDELPPKLQFAYDLYDRMEEIQAESELGDEPADRKTAFRSFSAYRVGNYGGWSI